MPETRESILAVLSKYVDKDIVRSLQRQIWQIHDLGGISMGRAEENHLLEIAMRFMEKTPSELSILSDKYPREYIQACDELSVARMRKRIDRDSFAEELELTKALAENRHDNSKPLICRPDEVVGILNTSRTMIMRPITPQPTHAAQPKWIPGDGHSGEGWYCGEEEYPEEGSVFWPCPFGKKCDTFWVQEPWGIKFYAPECGGSKATMPLREALSDNYKDNIDPKRYGDARWIGTNLLRCGVSFMHKAGAPEAVEQYMSWRPAIDMRRWMSRIKLEIEEVRVIRLHDINPFDAFSTGLDLPVPAGCTCPDVPEGFHDWSVKKRDKWFNDIARSTYFAQCHDGQMHVDAFQAQWEALYACGKHMWVLNPFIWVATIKEVEDGDYNGA